MPNIEVIFWHEADSGAKGELGIDEHGSLYWNGKPVVTKQKIALQWWVNLSAILAALSTVVLAVLAILTYSNDMQLNDKYIQTVTAHEEQLKKYKKEIEQLNGLKNEYISIIENTKSKLVVKNKNKNNANKTLNK